MTGTDLVHRPAGQRRAGRDRGPGRRLLGVPAAQLRVPGAGRIEPGPQRRQPERVVLQHKVERDRLTLLRPGSRDLPDQLRFDLPDIVNFGQRLDAVHRAADVRAKTVFAAGDRTERFVHERHQRGHLGLLILTLLAEAILNLAARGRAGVAHRGQLFRVNARIREQAVHLDAVDQRTGVERVDLRDEVEQHVEQPLRGSGRIGTRCPWPKAKGNERITHGFVCSDLEGPLKNRRLAARVCLWHESTMPRRA